MKQLQLALWSSHWLLVCLLIDPNMAAEKMPIVIAHRGASGYLPEHTLAAKALAYGQGADFLEQDVVLTQDDQPIVLHDIYLDTVTDVARRFPGRAACDGRFYAIDFTLAEIKQLSVQERFHEDTKEPVYARRFSGGPGLFHVLTLAEEIELVQGLNRTTGRTVGIYPEIKAPAWHRRRGKDVSRIVLAVLSEYGYREWDDLALVQCFDPRETRRLREEFKTRLRLVQLLGENDWHESDADYESMRSPRGLQQIAEYANGIGPWIPHVLTVDHQGNVAFSSLVREAHRAGLFVHPYTLRADDLPKNVPSLEVLQRWLFHDARVDGVFTDFPDRTRQFLDAHRDAPSR